MSKKNAKIKRKQLRKKLTLMHRFLIGAIADLESFREITARLLHELEEEGSA